MVLIGGFGYLASSVVGWVTEDTTYADVASCEDAREMINSRCIPCWVVGE